MSKFKVGDKVRVKAGVTTCSQRFAGQIVTVTETFDGLGWCKVNDIFGGVYNDELEAVTITDVADNAPASDPLEDLVRKANEGSKALAELARRNDLEMSAYDRKNEFVPFDSSRCALDYHGAARTLRLKPKAPAFEAFETSNGWRVEMKDGMLKIGCKSIEASDAARVARELLELENSSAVLKNIGNYNCVRSVKAGLKHNEHTLPWADAERILEALKKAGVQ